MEQNIIITVNSWQFISGLITICGILIGIAWHLSGRLGKIDGKIEGLDTRLTNMETNSMGLTTSSSPVVLSQKGERVLNDSGLKKFIDDNKEKLLEECGSSHNIKTAYDIQNSTFDYFDKLKFKEDIEKKLKEFAYKEGINMDLMRRIGGIYFRDMCLAHFKKTLGEVNGGEKNYEETR